MLKFFAAFRKEWLILTRDVAGLIVLFLMPMIMVVILSLVQEFGWNAISKEPRMNVLFVDEDHDSLAGMIRSGLVETRLFNLVTELDSVAVTAEIAREKVRMGDYQVGVVIPPDATDKIRQKINLMVTQIMSGIIMPVNNPFREISSHDSVDIIVYFDPAIRGTFKHSFMSKMKEFSLKIESRMIFDTFNKELQKLFPQYVTENKGYRETVYFTEKYPSGLEAEKIPSTSQHNVPSWAIFAMFFIVIPLTSSIIKEREEGSMYRLLTMPVSYFTVFMAKIGVYLIVCVIQFILMILAGIYLIPLFGMPSLEMGSNFIGIALMTIMASLAALGYSIMVGTIARTHQQAAAFGSVSVVILAAMGGLWVPIYFFPDVMKFVASLSPLNWAHVGFIDLFLRQGTLADILPALLKLFIFFLFTIGIAAFYRKLKPLNRG